MKHLGTKLIETNRLILRKPRVSDAKDMFNNWASSKEVAKFMSWKAQEKLEDAIELLTLWEKEAEELNKYNWLIELKEIKQAIGGISVVNFDERTSCAMIGYSIGTLWWGKEIVKEALTEVIKYLFEEVGVNQVCASHDPRNPNSGKVMKKCNMHYDGTFRQTYINNQGICNEVWYSILKEDYFKEKDIWDVLYNKALSVLNPVHYNSFVDAGGVASAIQTIDGNIYLGVCIDTCSGLGMCAERNAIGNMLTYGENKIKRIVAVMSDKKVGSPCGACREMLMQLDPSNQDLEILVDIETKETIKLKDLLPDWWGKNR